MTTPTVLRAKMQRLRVDRARDPHLPRFSVNSGDIFSGLVALFGLGLCFRGKGDPFTWVLLILSPLALRAVISIPFRQQLFDRVGFLWQQLEQFTQNKRHLPWRAAFLFAGLPILLLYLFEDRTMGSGDTAPVMPTAISIVREGNANLDEYFRNLKDAPLPYYVIRTPSGIYSNYPAGMVAFAMPVATIAWSVGADFREEIVYLRLEKWTAAWVAAFSLTLFFLLALHLTGTEPALVCTLVLATGSVMFTTLGQGLWQHAGVIFWSLLLLLLEFRSRKGHIHPGSCLVQGLCAATMLACRLSSTLFLAPFGVWLLLRSPRRACVVVAVALVAYAPWAWFYGSTYGSIFGPSNSQLSAMNWTGEVWASLAGLLFSPARGLLIYQPWLLLGALVFVSPLRQFLAPTNEAHEPVRWQWVCIAAIVLQIALVAAWRCWWGGYCWGSRLLSEIVPLLALLCVRPIAVLWASQGGRTAVVLCAVLAFGMHFTAVHYDAAAWNAAMDIDHHPDKLWSWDQAPFVHFTLR